MESINILNYTNQEIRIYATDAVDIPTNPLRLADKARFIGRCITLPSSGHAKCEIDRDSEDFFANFKNSDKKISLSKTKIGNANKLPKQQDNTIIIVSQLVFNSMHTLRSDIYMVDKVIRDENGSVVACRSFSRCKYIMQSSSLFPVRDYIQKEMIKYAKDEDALEHLVKLNNIINTFTK